MLFGLTGVAAAQQQGGQMQNMPGMDAPKAQGTDHSNMPGMNMQGMDHSTMKGMPGKVPAANRTTAPVRPAPELMPTIRSISGPSW